MSYIPLLLLIGAIAATACKPNCSDIRVVVRSMEPTGEYNRIRETDLWRGSVTYLLKFVVNTHEFDCEYAHDVWCGRTQMDYHKTESATHFVVPYNRIVFKPHQLREQFQQLGYPITVGQEDGPVIKCVEKPLPMCRIEQGIKVCTPPPELKC